MHDGLCAVVAYRPCFIICFPLWPIRFYILHAVENLVCELLSTGAQRRLYERMIQPEVSDSQGVHGGIPRY